MKRETLRAINALHRGQPLAMAVRASNPGNLGWVGVYPLDTTQEATQQFLRNHDQPVPLPNVRAFHIRRFEVEQKLVEQDVWLGESELQNKISVFAFGESDLAEKLVQLGATLEELAMPSKSDYPI